MVARQQIRAIVIRELVISYAVKLDAHLQRAVVVSLHRLLNHMDPQVLVVGIKADMNRTEGDEERRCGLLLW